MRTSRHLLVLPLLLLVSNVLAASYSENRSTVLVRPVAAANGQVEINGEVRDLASEIGLVIGKREVVTIAIDNVNPVLFSYEALEPSKEPTESFAAIQRFGEALTGFKQILDPSGARIGGPPVEIEGLDIHTFLTNSGNVIVRRDLAMMYIEKSASVDNGDISAEQADVGGWQSQKALKDIGGQFDIAQRILGKQLAGQQISYKLGGTSKQATSIGAIAKDIRATLNESTLADRLEMFPAIVLEKDQFLAMASILAAFEEAFLKIGGRIDIARIAYDPKFVISQKIVVKPNTQFAEFLSNRSKSFQKARSKSVVFVAEPKVSIHVSISPGVVYSFVDNPDFAASSAAGGQVIVAKTNNDVAALSGAVAINFTPDRYHGEGIEPFLQLGVVPDSDTPAMFVGVGFVGFGQVLFSAGAIYQEVNRLGGGLSVGDTLTSVDDLVVDDEWEAGLFVSIGVGFGD